MRALMSMRPTGIPTPRPIESVFEDFEVFVEAVCWPVFVTVFELGFDIALDELGFDIALDELGVKTVLDELGFM
jgi:hypothetical protein